MNKPFKTVTAYKITVFYTDDLPTETYYKRTREEAEALKAELLAEDDEVDHIEISEEPEEREFFNHEYRPATDPERMEV